MASICPTVTAYELHEYREQMEKVAPLTERLHIDLMDGVLAPTKSPSLEQIWLPEDKTVDIHIMYQNPVEQLASLIKLRPSLVILHVEANGNKQELAHKLRQHHIKAGIAVLKDTPAGHIKSLLDDIDHVLVFSGDLGHFGGQADLSLLEKVKTIKQWKPSIEIGWDGGINQDNIAELINGGVDVLNVGGFIQKADNPAIAYVKLKAVAEANRDEKTNT